MSFFSKVKRLVVRQPGEAFPRITLKENGDIEIGPGTIAADAFLKRIGVGNYAIFAANAIDFVSSSVTHSGNISVDGSTNLKGDLFLANAPTDLVGFYGAAPVAQAAAIATATDLASAITAVNAIRDALDSTGGVGITA